MPRYWVNVHYLTTRSFVVDADDHEWAWEKAKELAEAISPDADEIMENLCDEPHDLVSSLASDEELMPQNQVAHLGFKEIRFRPEPRDYLGQIPKWNEYQVDDGEIKRFAHDPDVLLVEQIAKHLGIEDVPYEEYWLIGKEWSCILRPEKEVLCNGKVSG